MRLRAVFFNQICPQSLNDLGNLLVFKAGHIAAGKNNDVQPCEQILIQTEGSAKEPLDPVSLNSKRQVLFPNNQTQARLLQKIGNSQYQEVAIRDLVFGLVEYRFELGRFR